MALLFWGLLFSCCGFAAAYGGQAGRQLSIAYLVAVIATIPASLIHPDWSDPQHAVLAVDLVLLFALARIALRSDRWFPIWFAGFHLVAVVSHLASLIATGFAAKVYFIFQSIWTLPMLLTLVIGVALDRHAGIHDDARSAKTRRPRIP